MPGRSEASHQHALEERAAQLLLVFVAQTRYPGPIFYEEPVQVFCDG